MCNWSFWNWNANRGRENILGEIMAENVPNFINAINPWVQRSSTTQAQEIWRKLHQSTSQLIYLKPVIIRKYRDKMQNKYIFSYMCVCIWKISHWKQHNLKDTRASSLKYWRKNCQPGILYHWKYLSKMKAEYKVFQTQNSFIISRQT